MATKNISRREALKKIIALPLAFYSGTRHSNAQKLNSYPHNSVLETAARNNPSLREKVYSAAERIKKATLPLTHESYILPISHPSSFDYHEEGMGVLLRPLNSKNTYLASCAHIWDFDLAEHDGIEKTLRAASERGITNPRREQIKERMKVAGYEVEPKNMIGFDKKLEFSVLKVNDIISRLEKFSTPLEIDITHQISHQVGDKVHWISQSQNGFPFVEANIRYANVGLPGLRASGQPSQEQVMYTDVPISYECGKPVFSLYAEQPVLSGIITAMTIDSKWGPARSALFASANHIFNAIKKYEERH